MEMKNKNRVVAFLLALFMICFTFAEASVTAVASPNTTVEVTEETEDEITDVSLEEVFEVNEEGTIEEADMEAMEEGDEEPYNGEVFESTWSTTLSIDSDDMETFSDEELLRIINYRKKQELRFESVSVNYPYVEGNPQGIVSTEVWNGLCELLQDEYGDLMFQFIEEPDPESNWYCISRSWICFAPAATNEDVQFHVNWSVGENGKGVKLNFANTDFPAQDVEMQLYFETDSSQCETVRAAFASGTQAILFKDNQVIMNCQLRLGKEVGSRVDFTIRDINDLEPDTEYILNAKEYTGTIGEDNDGGRYCLEIDRTKQDGTVYTDDEIVEMLQWNQEFYGNAFTTIHFYDTLMPEASERVISGKVANAARSIMSTETTSLGGHRIGYYTRSDSGSNVFDVYMGSPKENFAPQEDATLRYTLEVSETEAQFTFEAPEYDVEQLQMRMAFEKGTAKANALENLFGENVTRYLWVGSESVSYDSTTNGVMLTFIDVKDLQRNQVYTIEADRSEYVPGAPGKIMNDYGYRILQVSAQEIGAQTWEKGSIRNNLAAYKNAIDSGQVQPFNEITIVQKEGDNNVIYKDDYNFLRGLLYPTGYGKLVFEFEKAGSEQTTDKLIWRLESPTKASADVKLNVSYAAAIGQNAVKMKLESTTYPAKFTSVRCHTGRDTELGTLFDKTFGNVTNSINNKRVAVALSFNNLKEIYPLNSTYSLDDEPDRAKNVDLLVGNLQSYGKNEFYLITINDYPEIIALGKESGYRLETIKKPDGAVKWQGYMYHANLTEEGILTPVSETDDDMNTYIFAASFLQEGQPVIEVYSGIIDRRVVEIKFANGSYEQPVRMELPSKAEGNSESSVTTLKWISYPTGIEIYDEELQWSVDGTAVELVKDSDGNCTGQIKAVSEGEAVVTLTYKGTPEVTASIKVVVSSSILDEMNTAKMNIVAVKGIHKNLKDLNEQLPKGYAWTNPEMSLLGFEGKMEVRGVYTAEDGRSADCKIEIEILSFKDLSIEMKNSTMDSVADGAAIQSGAKVYFNNLVQIRDQEILSVEEFNADEVYGKKYRLSVVPTNKTADLVKESDNTEAGRFVYEASVNSTGKKTFSFELQVSDTNGNKLGVVANKSVTVTVVNNAVMDWENITVSRNVSGQNIELSVPAATDEKGRLVILQSAEKYIPITAKSVDNSLCKITGTKVDGENYTGQTATLVEYEVKKGGRVYIQLTASDEIKSVKTIRFDAEDLLPVAEQNAITIDKARKNPSALVKWQLHTDTSVGTAGTVLAYTIGGKENTDFEVTVVKTENLKSEVKVEVKNTALKNGKYKLKLNMPVTYQGEAYSDSFTPEITVNVKETKPDATIKQTNKVNLLYKDNSGDGLFVITPKNDWTVKNITLEDQSGQKKCDYELQITDGQIFVRLKEGGNPKNTKGKLVITTNEYADKRIEKNITIATVTKKPTIIFNKKSDTLFANYDRGEDAYAELTLLDKATNQKITEYALEIKDGEYWVSLEDDRTYIYHTNKNTYYINHEEGVITFNLDTSVKGTDKFKLRVKPHNWNDNNYVELSYSIKVDMTMPKLVLENSTLILNKNEAVSSSQLAKTKLSLKGADYYFSYKYDFVVDGYDIKAELIKNRYLNFNLEDGEIKVSFNGDTKNLATGNYKFNVRVWSEDTNYINTVFTVKVVDVAVEKCISMKAKGTIDILRREDTFVTYTVKTFNLHGELVNCVISGADADKFYVSEVKDGRIIVKAKDKVRFSTKETYTVIPVLTFENEEEQYSVKANVQKIKVKQGKPKVSVSTIDGAQNVLYRDRDNKIALDFTAVLDKKPVSISRVELVNYTTDLRANCKWNPETGAVESVTLTQYDEKQILVSGKTWNLKFNVYFTDGAGNEKVNQVSYKLVVK